MRKRRLFYSVKACDEKNSETNYWWSLEKKKFVDRNKLDRPDEWTETMCDCAVTLTMKKAKKIMNQTPNDAEFVLQQFVRTKRGLVCKEWVKRKHSDK